METDFILSKFSSNLQTTRKCFEAFVKFDVGEPRRKEFHGEKNVDSRIFGDDFFVATVLEKAELKPIQKPDVDAVIAAIKEIYRLEDDELTGISLDAFTAEARALAAWATLEFEQREVNRVGKVPEARPINNDFWGALDRKAITT